MRRVVRICALVALVTAVLVSGRGAASAATWMGCPHGGNYASTLCWNLGGGPGIEGAQGTWADRDMWTSPDEYAHGGHVNNELWLYTHFDNR